VVRTPRFRRPKRSLLFAVTLTALLAFPTGIVLAAHFNDVPNSNPFHGDIQVIADAGVTVGCGGGNFCPKDNVTREQMAAFMNRLGALAPGKTPVVNADRLDGLHAQQLVRAGGRVAANGVLNAWFNNGGGQPVVTRVGNGQYRIQVPGRSFTNLNFTGSVTILDTTPGMARLNRITDGRLLVDTYDTNGGFADRAFHFVVFDTAP
jgi:hypothetical protein